MVLKSKAIKAMLLMQKKFVSICSFQPCFGFGRAVLKAAKKQPKIHSLKKKLNIFKGIEISFKNWGLYTCAENFLKNRFPINRSFSLSAMKLKDKQL